MFSSIWAAKTPRAKAFSAETPESRCHPAKPSSAAASNVATALPHYTYDTTISPSLTTLLSIRTNNHTLLVVYNLLFIKLAEFPNQEGQPTRFNHTLVKVYFYRLRKLSSFVSS